MDTIIELGNVDTEQIKKDFLKKLKARRPDAEEFTFGTIKGEQMLTTVYHSTCGHTFESRPYLFLQEKWPKRCPYCASANKSTLTEADIQKNVLDFSAGVIKMTKDEPIYIGKQKYHNLHLECLNCGYEFERNYQNIPKRFNCPKCKHGKKKNEEA